MNNVERWAWICLVAGTLATAVTGASATDLLRRYRVRRMAGPTEMASPPFVPAADAPDCGVVPGVPELIGPDFDPGAWDQIDLAGNGRLVAYASSVTAASAGSRAVVVLSEGSDTAVVAEAAGDDDQPSLGFDRFGWRMAFRGSTGVAGESASDIYLHTVTRAGVDAGVETTNLTGLDTGADETAFDPSLAARIRVREVVSDVKVRERDARVVFVSNGDLDKGARPRTDADPGRNPDGLLQVFLWSEADGHFEQITRNVDAAASVNRPVISQNGRVVVFEATADLDPTRVNPADPTQVGNPGGVRQLFLWTRHGRHGRLRQITWSDEDCLAPRMSRSGRHVYFCSRGDPLPGGNPEGNFEIFRWTAGRSGPRRLAQLTQTTSGDSVLPRPLRSPRRFVFYSTAMPPTGGLVFGGGPRQCGPSALLWSGGHVRTVYAVLDTVNVQLVTEGNDPVFVGPPAAVSPTKVHFATNDATLNPPQPEGAASLVRFHLARATRYSRR